MSLTDSYWYVIGTPAYRVTGGILHIDEDLSNCIHLKCNREVQYKLHILTDDDMQSIISINDTWTWKPHTERNSEGLISMNTKWYIIHLLSSNTSVVFQYDPSHFHFNANHDSIISETYYHQSQLIGDGKYTLTSNGFQLDPSTVTYFFDDQLVGYVVASFGYRVTDGARNNYFGYQLNVMNGNDMEVFTTSSTVYWYLAPRERNDGRLMVASRMGFKNELVWDGDLRANFDASIYAIVYREHLKLCNGISSSYDRTVFGHIQGEYGMLRDEER